MRGTKIGKIKKVSFGIGGYQDAQFGLTLEFGSDIDGWGVGTFLGFWCMEPSEHAQWDADDQNHHFADLSHKVIETLKKANVRSVNDLLNIPVECTFDANALKEWRILSEVI